MKKSILIIVLAICIQSLAISAQTTAGRLSGVVSGPDGVLPNATITVRDNKTGKELTFVSKEDGTFLFPQLEFGAYTVTVSSTGFKTFVAKEVKIDVGREYNLNPVLEIGNIQENVTITAGADVVTSDTAQITNTVSPQQILSLPLLTRTPLSLTTLQAGTQANTFQETMINGMRTSFTNITRDGINIQDNYIRQNATDFAPGSPTVDDVSEFTISTSNQEADQGYGGAQIRLATPRGTKGFHGALFAYNRNSAFQANNFFNNRSSDPSLNKKPAFRNRNQFGGKIGGPLWLPHFGEGTGILKHHAFFFFAYEDVRDPVSVSRTRTILTPSARTGIFTYNRTIAGDPINTNGVSCPSGAVSSVCTANILTLANALGFANTPTNISPAIQSRIISQLPSAGNSTSVGDQLNTTGLVFNRAENQTRRNYTSRIDIDFNDKNTFNGVYNYVEDGTLRNSQDPSGFTTIPRGDVVTATKTLALAYRRVFSPKIVNEIRGGLFFNDVLFGASGNPSVVLTLPSTLGLSNPENNNGEQGRFVKHYNLQDNVDWVLGSHSFKFGGQIQYFQPHPFDTFSIIPTATIGTSNQTPFFTCATNATCQLPGGISTTQLGIANSLLALYGGYVTGYQQQFNLVSPEQGFVAGAPNVTPFEYWDNSLFVSDRWRITNNLTLNLGLRYELFGALKQTNGAALEPVISDPDNPAASLLDRNATNNIIGGNSGNKYAFYKNDYNNFAPSIGFAYAPKFEGKIGRFLLGDAFVIRGGYSHIYGNDQLVTAVLQAPANIVGFGSRNGIAVSPTTGSTQLNSRLDQGLPSIPAPTLSPLPPYSFIRNNTPGIGGANTNGTVFGIDPKLQTPMYKQYSFGVQREFFGNTALEIRYVGTRSDNLLRAYNLNQVNVSTNGILEDFNRALGNLSLPGATTAFCNPQTVTGCQALQIFRSSAAATATTVGGATAGPGTLLVGTGGLSAATFNTLIKAGTPGDLVNNFYQLGFNNHPTLNNPTAVPYVNILPNPAAGLIAFLTNDAKSRYNSLQVEVRRRFTQGLYFQANYTYSKNMTDAIGGDQFYFEPYLDNARPELNLQRSDGDQTHVFNFNGVYQLPFGKGKMFLNRGGFIDKIFGGWEISGLMNLASGAPISIVDPRGTFNTAARSARQPARSTLSAQEIQKLVGIFERDGKIYFIDPSIINPATGRAAEGFGTSTFTGQVFFNNGPGETGNIPLAIIDGPKYFRVDAALLKNIAINERMRIQLRAEAFNLLNRTNFTFTTTGQQIQNITSATFGQTTTASTPRVIQFAVRFEF